jgi:hypothetical protein
MCPCNLSFDHGATYDYCRVTLAFNIREGDIENANVAGRKVVLIADTPKVMTDGNWKVGAFVDQEATDEQYDRLIEVFGGQRGGPMAAMAPLIGEMVGAQRAIIEMNDDGLRHSVRVDDSIVFEIQDIVPYGKEDGQPIKFDGMFHPIASDLTMAEAVHTEINAFGISYQGKTGVSYSNFTWTG